MKIKSILLPVFVFALSSPAFSYVVYNKTSTSYRVSDVNTGGMKVTIPAYSSAACNPKSRGCRGNMDFYLYHSDGTIGCHWKGKLDNGTGYYFVITSTGRSWPFDSCTLELYRD